LTGKTKNPHCDAVGIQISMVNDTIKRKSIQSDSFLCVTGDFVYKKLFGCGLLIFGSIAWIFRGFLDPSVQSVFELLGIMSIPIFAHALVVGLQKSRNSGHYFLRLAATVFLAQLIIYLWASGSGIVGNGSFLDPMYALLIGFGAMYGLEVLVPCGPAKIASMRLLEANAQTKSDRFDIRVSPQDLSVYPPGLKVPSWSVAMLQLFGISLVVFCLALPFFLAVHLGVFIVLLILVFYAVEKVVSGPKAVAAFLCMAMLLATYMFIQFRISGKPDPVGVAIATVFICYLPEKSHRPNRWIRYAFYAFYPIHILALFLIRQIFFVG